MKASFRLRVAGTRLLLASALCLVTLGLGFSANASNPNTTFTTIDVPGAGTGPLKGTFPWSINPNGTIAGFIRDANNVRHGFVLDQHGMAITFDAPGAGTVAGRGTRAYAINPAGAITGYFDDNNAAAHGCASQTVAKVSLVGRLYTFR